MRTLNDLSRQVANCVSCELSASRTQVVFGTGHPRADYFFIGEGPGAKEDIEGEPFIGRSGKLLNRLIEEEFARVIELLKNNNCAKVLLSKKGRTLEKAGRTSPRGHSQ